MANRIFLPILITLMMVAHARSASIMQVDAQPLLDEISKNEEKIVTSLQILTLDNENLTSSVDTLLNTFYNTSSTAYDIVQKCLNDSSTSNRIPEEELTLSKFLTLLGDRVKNTDISETVQQAIEQVKPEAEKIQAYFTILSQRENGTLSVEKVQSSFLKLKEYLTTQWKELVNDGKFSDTFDKFVESVADGSKRARDSFSDVVTRVVDNVRNFTDSVRQNFLFLNDTTKKQLNLSSIRAFNFFVLLAD